MSLLGALGAAALALPALLAAVALLAGWDALLSARLSDGRWRGGAVLTPLRQGLRLLDKEWRGTERPDPLLWTAAPLLLLALSLAALAVWPYGPDWAPAAMAVGVVYLTAMLALTMVAVFLAGWGPNSKYPLIGGYRFIGLMLAYEMPFAITVIAVALPAESLSLQAIVAAQQQGPWNAVLQPVGLGIYLLSAMAIAFWGPFALPQAADLAGGVELELGGAALLLWRLGRYALLLTTSAYAVPLFFAGGAGPWLPAPAWLALKTALVAVAVVWLGRVLVRLRLSAFMRLAWIGLIPLSLANLFLVGLLVLLWPELVGEVRP